MFQLDKMRELQFIAYYNIIKVVFKIYALYL